MERPAKAGESPVRENGFVLVTLFLSTAPYGDWAGSREDWSPKAKYSQRPIVNKYREGKVKSSPVRAVK